MERQQTNEDVGFHTTFELVEDWSLSEWRLHIAERVLGTTEQRVDPPSLIG
jgi:hypothetical protein